MGPDLQDGRRKIATTTRAVLALAAKHRITSRAPRARHRSRTRPAGRVGERDVEQLWCLI
jgi:hypothetical protein